MSPGRWRHPVHGGAGGLVLGIAIGVGDGLRAASLAGESARERLVGLVTVDAAVGAALGLAVGLAIALLSVFRPSLSPPGRWWRVLASAGLLAAGALAAGLRTNGAPPTLDEELRAAWRLERALPALAPAEGGPVIVVSLDTVRYDALADMPALSRRAAGALRYTAAHSTSSWTLPSMASVQTGAYYPEHGAAQMEMHGTTGVRTGLDPRLPTLAERLREAGYVNAAVVTNPFNGIRYGMHRGFDRFHDLSRGALRAYALRRSSLLRPLFPVRRDGAGEVSDAALTLLDPLHTGRFFLWLHYLDAHAPYAADPARFDPLGPCALPACFNDWSGVRTGSLTLSTADRARIRTLYASDLAYLDGQLERVFAALDATGVSDRALVIVLADHGEEFWDHGGVEHGATFFEEVVHVPLIVWAPGHPAADVAHGVDIAAVPDAVLSWVRDGTLGPLEPAAPDRVTRLGSLLFSDDGAACTDGHVKAIVSQGRTRVYDLVADPGETRDLGTGDAGRTQALAACLSRVTSAPHGARGPGGDAAALRALGYAQ